MVRRWGKGLNLAMDYAANEAGTPHMPFAECGAMSQGYI